MGSILADIESNFEPVTEDIFNVCFERIELRGGLLVKFFGCS